MSSYFHFWPCFRSVVAARQLTSPFIREATMSTPQFFIFFFSWQVNFKGRHALVLSYLNVFFLTPPFERNPSCDIKKGLGMTYSDIGKVWENLLPLYWKFVYSSVQTLPGAHYSGPCIVFRTQDKKTCTTVFRFTNSRRGKPNSEIQDTSGNQSAWLRVP